MLATGQSGNRHCGGRTTHPPFGRTGLGRVLAASLCALCAVGTTGCYRYRVSAPAVSALKDPVTETKWSFFWGAVQEGDSETTCECLNNGIKETTASTNVLYLLLSAATLGMAVPLEMEYVCGKPPQGGASPDPPKTGQCKNIVILPPPPGGPAGSISPAPSAKDNPTPAPAPCATTAPQPPPAAPGFVPNDPDRGL